MVQLAGEVGAQVCFAALEQDFTMHQVVHDLRVRRPGADADAAAPIPLRSPDGVVLDLDAIGVPQLDPAVRPTGDHVVTDDAVGDVDQPFAGEIGGGLAGIAEGHTPVAVHDEIALHYHPPRAHPNEDGRAPAAVSPSDVPEDVITESPVFERHHVNGGNVVAAEEPVGGWDLGVLERAVSDRALHRANIRVLSRRAFDRPHADIPEPAIVNVDVFRGILGFDFDPVGTAVREREVGDGDALAAANVENVVAAWLGCPTPCH